jgi:hypothetical protein
MAWIVRKISRSKWESKPELQPSFIGADAVTSDLRTSRNTLSFWECEGDSSPNKLDEVVLALAGTLQRPEKFDIAWLDRSLAESIGIEFKNTKGQTPLVNFRELHVDATNLDLSRLDQLSRLIAHAIRTNDNHRRLTKAEVIEMLCLAVHENQLALEDLSENQRALIEAVEQKLQS